MPKSANHLWIATSNICCVKVGLGIRNESKIFCSDKSVRKLKANGYTDVYNQIDLPLAKYNFFTCRFFSAVDIEIRQKPDILILTNLKEATHTMIDPFTEAIQIYGRFREKYHRGQIPFNSLTHITNLNPDMLVKNNREVNLMVQTWKQLYDYTQNQLSNATNPTVKQTLKNDLKNLSYAALLDENGTFNYFSLDNLHNEERVKRYYVNFNDWLNRAYRYTGHFNVNQSITHYPFVTSFQSANLTATQKREKIILKLEELSQHKINNPTFDIEPYKEIWRKEVITTRENGDLIVDAYDYLGKSIIVNIGYSRPARLKEAIDKQKAIVKEKNLFSVILNEIKQKYTLNQTASKNDIKNFLIDVYRLNGIDISVTQTTIQKYCNVTSSNSTNPPTYTIRGYKA